METKKLGGEEKKEMIMVVIGIVLSAIVLLVLPMILFDGKSENHVERTIRYFAVNPVFLVLLGIAAGMRIKKRWFVPVIAAVFFVLGETVIMKGRFLSEFALIGLIYIVLASVFMGVTSYMHDAKKKPDYKAVLKKSLLVAGIVNGAGILFNLLSYFTLGMILLGIPTGGDDCQGSFGFGLYAERTFPITTLDDPAASGTSSLTFDPLGLFVSCAVVFAITFAILSIREISRMNRQ